MHVIRHALVLAGDEVQQHHVALVAEHEAALASEVGGGVSEKVVEPLSEGELVQLSLCHVCCRLASDDVVVTEDGDEAGLALVRVEQLGVVSCRGGGRGEMEWEGREGRSG